MNEMPNLLNEMTDRSREVFRRVVEGYLTSGDPIGSRTLTRSMTEKLSAATIRNVMQDLEYLGLLDSPHVSAGRIPTHRGLRLFVDGLMELGTVAQDDRAKIEASLGDSDADVTALLDQVSATLSGITRSATVVLAPKTESAVRHIEFVSLSPERALVVLVFADGHVENRIFTPPPGQTPSSMREAANFLSSIADGRRLSDLSKSISAEIAERRQEIDSLAHQLVETGVAFWANPGERTERLIVRGQSNLIEGETDNLDRIRTLFDDLERKRDISDFLELAEAGEGVRIFIGAENKLFSLSGSTLVVSPYMNTDRKIIGAIGVIGPTRLNYGRIVPIVDYTAQLVGRMVSDRSKG
ncbi:MAG: heat-inducible transcriptional repressor HrcA [Pseudorhodobacter sp.]|nr:heat-inducible transcriptional repressor HrcA [Pseudorhodobacter sp.]